MGAWRTVGDAIELLKAIPSAVIPTSHIGTASPSTSQGLPAIAVALKDAHESPSSLGGLVGTNAVSEDEWLEQRVIRTAGVMQLLMYAAGADDLDELTQATATVLEDYVELRKRGFLGFSILSIGPGEEKDIGRSQQAGAFSRTIECSIVHEEIPDDDSGPGGLIRSVHVEMNERFHEVMDVTK